MIADLHAIQTFVVLSENEYMFVLLVMSHLEVVVFMFGLDRYLAAIGQSPFTSAEILERISLIAELEGIARV